MATASAQDIDDLLQCPICLDILQDPKVLDCQHTFCADCLTSHLNARSGIFFAANALDCKLSLMDVLFLSLYLMIVGPTCRVPTNIINNSVDCLPRNYIVSDIIERKYGRSVPQRPPGYSQQVQDRLQKMRKEKDTSEDYWEYVKPAAAALVGVLGGLLLAKGVKKMCNQEKK